LRLLLLDFLFGFVEVSFKYLVAVVQLERKESQSTNVLAASTQLTFSICSLY
jgi:hypothetical protein